VPAPNALLKDPEEEVRDFVATVLKQIEPDYVVDEPIAIDKQGNTARDY
jgi:hypothetical protein